jgi:uncharacterized protein YhaN
MRIREIHLEKYGPFEDEAFSLGSGFVVVYGQNEAGKSTLLNAMGDFLWGYSNRNHPRAFTYAVGKMRLTGTVAEGGQQKTWTRRLKILTDATGTEAEPPWDPQGTGSINEWRQGFGLDLDHLQKGGEDLIRGGGDLADVIFLAETGVAIKEVRDDLEKRMDSVYKERANSPSEVRKALQLIEKLTAQIEESEASAADVAELRARHDELETQKTGLGKGLRGLEREARRMDEFGRCAEKAAYLRDTEADLKDVLDSGPTLNQTDTKHLETDLARITAAGESIAADRLKLGQLEARMTRLELHPEVTRQAELIKELGHNLQAVKADRDLLRDVGMSDSLGAIVLDLLHQLGVEPEGDFGSNVSDLRIAEDERNQLDREATRLTDARGNLDREQAAVRKAETALQTLAQTDVDAAKDSALVDARSRRDASWSSIRKPWLSGDLPTEPDRVEMARELDGDIRGADQMAESQAKQLTDAAEDRGLRLAGEGELDRKQVDLANAGAQFEEVRKFWDDLVVERGLARKLDPDSWSVRARVLEQLESAWKDLRQDRLARDQAQLRVDEFSSDVDKLSGLPGGDEQDPVRRIGALGDLLSKASKAEGASAEIDAQLVDLRDDLQKQEGFADRASKAVAEITDEHDAEAESLLARSEKALGFAQQAHDLTEALKSMRNPESDLQELLDALVDLDEVDRLARVEALAADIEDINGQVGALHVELGSVGSELTSLESRASVVELSAERLAQGEQLRASVDEYRLLRLQIDMLDRYFEQSAGQSHSAVLDAAGKFLSRLTFGRYVGFEIITEEDRKWIEIQHHPQAGEPTNPMRLKELSEGTADQVFLALRLAGIQARQAQRKEAGLPTLPVALDDVLIAHDDARAAQALHVLADLAQDFQIILLTHHRSVLESSEAIPGIKTVELASVDSSSL